MKNIIIENDQFEYQEDHFNVPEDISIFSVPELAPIQDQPDLESM